MPLDWMVVLAGTLVGSFVSGLTGFGLALVSLPFYLHVLPPAASAQLASACSVASQIRTMSAIWPSIDAGRALPMILAGLAGVPLGILILPHVGLSTFKIAVGIVLVSYCAVMLAMPPRAHRRSAGRTVEVLVGLGAGIMGGIAGLSGVLPTAYAALMGWGKEEKRGLFQAFNASMLTAMLVWSIASGIFSWQAFTSTLIALPATLVGAALGHAAFKRIDDRRFDRIVLALLLLSGLMLIATAL